MATKSANLPAMVPFPEEAWRKRLVPDEWEACLDSWIILAGAHLALSAPEFTRLSAKDESIRRFLTTYAAGAASESVLSHENPHSATVSKTKHLRKQTFLLSHRLLELKSPPEVLLCWDFLADLCRIYGPNHGKKIATLVWTKHLAKLESSMASLKTLLTTELAAGLNGNLKVAESQLKRLNHLIHAFPPAATFFLAGSDFLDSLISCYKLMNPPLRQAILSTTYLSVLGLMEGEKPNFSLLVDQLYSLNAAAEAHKAGPTNVNDSLVAELVSATPLLKQLQQKIKASESGSKRADSVLVSLEGFRKPGNSGRPAHLVKKKKKIDKGKEIALGDYGQDSNDQVHIHRMSLISQVQDLFPDLGSGFVVRLLDEYGDNVEEVITHLLEESLPSHLQDADRSEALNQINELREHNSRELAPSSTPSQFPERHNVFDGDEFDELIVDTSKLHFGRRNPDQTADDVLQDRSNAPNKAAILSALATFDSDDDERDDSYDVADVGGTVDSANPEDVNADAKNEQDEVLFRAFKATPDVFAREATTRRIKARISLRGETGLTDEAIEGWGLMLLRDPRQQKRLEAKFTAFTGNQNQLAPTSWRASPAGSGTEDSDFDNSNNRGRGGFLRGAARGGGRGRGRGNVAGATGDKDTEVARQRKEANKGSRANHNRRDQRARKMARGGFPG